jgi:hypothetical protein
MRIGPLQACTTAAQRSPYPPFSNSSHFVIGRAGFNLSRRTLRLRFERTAPICVPSITGRYSVVGCSELNVLLARWSKGVAMPSFRCCFIDRHGHIIFRADIDAEDLDAAKHRAFDVLCAEGSVRSSAVHGLEIWQDKMRLYPDSTVASQDRIASR